jgi:hypothetical protein
MRSTPSGSGSCGCGSTENIRPAAEARTCVEVTGRVLYLPGLPCQR